MNAVVKKTCGPEESKRLNVGIFLYPEVTMLDAYAPLQILAVSQLVNVFTFAKESSPLPSDANVDLLPNYGFHNVPEIDVLIVPGSGNPLPQIEDADVISTIRSIGDKAQYVTSVCTGALILAEAGLLEGYQTATHWAYAKAIKKYPNVSYVSERVVIDRNRMSGGGITSGLDFALTLISEIAGKEVAQGLELILEYDPQPPFKTGNHKQVKPELKNYVQAKVDRLASDLFSRV